MEQGKLTAKQRRFIEAYNGNATEAARIAGYKNPERVSINNMKNPVIREAIRWRGREITGRIIADREERQAFWTTVMHDDEARMADRLKASELLGKSEGDFLERTEIIGGVDPLSITVRFVDADADAEV